MKAGPHFRQREGGRERDVKKCVNIHYFSYHNRQVGSWQPETGLRQRVEVRWTEGVRAKDGVEQRRRNKEGGGKLRLQGERSA